DRDHKGGSSRGALLSGASSLGIGEVTQEARQPDERVVSANRGPSRQTRRSGRPRSEDRRDSVRDLARRNDVPIPTRCDGDVASVALSPDQTASNPGEVRPKAAVATTPVSRRRISDDELARPNATPPTDLLLRQPSANSRLRQPDTSW